MDANGTRYHLLQGKGDWARCDVSLPGSEKVLLGDAWQKKQNTPLDWDDRRYELRLTPLLSQYIASPKDQILKPQDRRGASCDRFGNWYWIDTNKLKIRVCSAGDGVVSDFWPIQDRIPLKTTEAETQHGDFNPIHEPAAPEIRSFSGLLVTELHYLVVGVEPITGQKAGGLLVFDLFAGGSPVTFNWPVSVPFHPFDLAPLPEGGVWVLDRENQRYWGLDRHFQLVPNDQESALLSEGGNEDFQPISRKYEVRRAPISFPKGISLGSSFPLHVQDAVAIEALPDGSVLILDSSSDMDFAIVHQYHFGTWLGQATTGAMTDYIEEDSRQNFRLPGHDFVFIPEQTSAGSLSPWQGSAPDRLYIVSSLGNQTFAFDFRIENGVFRLTPVADVFLPMRLFSGKALVGVCSLGDDTSAQEAVTVRPYYDSGERWLPLIAQPRPRYAEYAVLDTYVMDGRAPGVIWHRLMLDAILPLESSVQVFSRSANEKQNLENAAWKSEPALYLRSDGSELPYARPFPSGINPVLSSAKINKEKTESQNVTTGKGTWELLIQQAVGQYCQLRLVIRGNSERTPRLRSMRVYYPRFSYVSHYLPKVYQQDEQSASFLERFLANMEGFFTATEDRIANLQLLMDVSSAPPETLDWLAAWFGAVLDPAWPEGTRRLFLRNAMLLYQYRGTRRGLVMALRLSMESANQHIFDEPTPGCDDGGRGGIRVIEKFLTRQMPAVYLGDPTQAGGEKLMPIAERWQPAQGGAVLTSRYRKFIEANDSNNPLTAGELFPISQPQDGHRQLWVNFCQQTLGFVPLGWSLIQQDLAALKNQAVPTNPGTASLVPVGVNFLWQNFLARRYGSIEAYITAYSLGTQILFSEVSFPTKLPVDGAPLNDWFLFESVILLMAVNAHRFSVLIPMPFGLTVNSPEYRQRLTLTQRIIDLEKPAHTTYDVRFYWNMFRLGEARLGIDTLIQLGGRSPELMTPLVAGHSYLSESYLGSGRNRRFFTRFEQASR